MAQRRLVAPRRRLVARGHLLLGPLALLATLTALLAAPAVHAQAQETSIEGQVVNATPGGGGVEGLTVLLHQHDQGGVPVATVEATTDDQGWFRFDAVEYDPTFAYGISLTYQDAIYVLNVDLSNGDPGPITLEVYDSSDDEDALSASLASVLFAWADSADQTVSTLEIVKIVNRSDHTYVPGSGVMGFLRFGLPPGAQGLRVDTALPGADFIQVDEGFALLASVPPGEHEVMYTYRFPYSGTAVEFTKSLRYGADLLRVLAPVEALSLSGRELGEAETVTIGERRYRLLQTTGLPKGAQFSVQLDELPEALPGQQTGGVVPQSDRRLNEVRFEYVAPVALGMLMASLIGFVFWRRANERRRATAGAVSGEESQTVRRMIADLEHGRSVGALSDDEYRRRRAVLDTRLAFLDGG